MLRYLFSFGKLVETYFLNENLDVSNVDLDDMKFVNKMITLMDSFYQTFLNIDYRNQYLVDQSY